jgi:hypothetical protein
LLQGAFQRLPQDINRKSLHLTLMLALFVGLGFVGGTYLAAIISQKVSGGSCAERLV